MDSAAERYPQPGCATGRCQILLPAMAGGTEAFDLAWPLLKCVGIYARIPEYAHAGHLLTIITPTGEAAF